MANREFEQAIAAEVEQWEGASVSFEAGSNHPKAKLVFGELIQKRPFSSTPGDRRSLANTLADVRRTLRGMGATRGKDATETEDEAVLDKVYRKPNDGKEKRPDPVQAEPAKVKPDVADQLVVVGAVTPEKAAASRSSFDLALAANPPVVLVDDDDERDALLAELQAQVDAIVDGIYFGLPDTVYHAVPRLSASGLQKLCVSPGTFWKGSWLDPERPELDDESTKAQVIGKAYHTARLEPHLFEGAYVRELNKAEFPKGTVFTGVDMGKALELLGEKKSGSVGEQAERLAAAGFDKPIWHLAMAEWEAFRGDRVALPAKVYDEITRDMERIHGNAEIAELLTGGEAEVSIFWTDQHGLKMKARVDYLQADAWADFKTFDNTRGKVLAQALADAVRYNRYHVQAVNYRDAVEAIRLGGLQIQGNATDGQRALVAAIQLRPGELCCWYIFNEKGGIPNLLAKEFPFYTIPMSARFNGAIAADDEARARGDAAQQRKSKLHIRGRQDIDGAKRQFVLHSQVYEPGQPWYPIEARGVFDDMDFSDYWLDGKSE
jgi:hypothetical protein